MSPRAIPVIGFTAWSGTGKTTLLKSLLPLLRARGLRIGVVKHAHHDFDVDVPGKDSYELRKAGATHVLVGSRKRWALVVETDSNEDPPLVTMLARLSNDALDLILVEGMKHAAIPKIELHRPAMGRPLLSARDPRIVAVACDAPVAVADGVTVLDLNDVETITRFIVQYFKLNEDAGTTTPSSVAFTPP